MQIEFECNPISLRSGLRCADLLLPSFGVYSDHDVPQTQRHFSGVGQQPDVEGQCDHGENEIHGSADQIAQPRDSCEYQEGG